ncbi:MAG: M20/M25/M40 family metallo-hydrolase [Candidatus Eisenbacteria bacterium]|nr:M20/M25/M40 family metallo-hydrolase [Candidatus Eisenbacteria bacterium]
MRIWRMKTPARIRLPTLLLLSGIVYAENVELVAFPSDCGQRAMVHVEALAELGPRPAGSAAERSAAIYVRNELAGMGLDVRIEEFSFEIFEIEKFLLSCCDSEMIPDMLGLNPYKAQQFIEAAPVTISPSIGSDELSALDLAGRFAVTAEPAPFFAIMFGRPMAVAYVDSTEYELLADADSPMCRLDVSGRLDKHESANILAAIGSREPDASEIVLTAHYDSYREGPGADDNASGIGVLLELARHFAKHGVEPGVKLTFVSVAAEELGVVGSRAYLDAHLPGLSRCDLLVNLDQVGGPRGPYVEVTGGTSGLPDAPPENRFPESLNGRAWEGLHGGWRLIDERVVELFTASTRPPSLEELISDAATAVGCVPTGNMGGDQQVFTQAGIVATSIGSSGNSYHNPEDRPEQVVVEQLEVVGHLAAEIVFRAMVRSSKR